MLRYLEKQHKSKKICKHKFFTSPAYQIILLIHTHKAQHMVRKTLVRKQREEFIEFTSSSTTKLRYESYRDQTFQKVSKILGGL